MGQEATSQKTVPDKVPVGIGTYTGLVVTIASAAIAIAQSINDNQALLTGQNKAAGVIAFVAPIATALGRMFQAAQLPKAAAIANEVGQIPAALFALAESQTRSAGTTSGTSAPGGAATFSAVTDLGDAAKQAEQNLAELEASPDHEDGPHVAYATLEDELPGADTEVRR
jgi:hypothetical protein